MSSDTAQLAANLLKAQGILSSTETETENQKQMQRFMI